MTDVEKLTIFRVAFPDACSKNVDERFEWLRIVEEGLHGRIHHGGVTLHSGGMTSGQNLTEVPRNKMLPTLKHAFEGAGVTITQKNCFPDIVFSIAPSPNPTG